MKRAISNKEMAGELITEGSEEDIKLQPFITPVNHNTLASEVQNKMIIMGHQILSCHVPVVRSFFVL
jgi:hypothetical protein